MSDRALVIVRLAAFVDRFGDGKPGGLTSGNPLLSLVSVSVMGIRKTPIAALRAATYRRTP
jgi:hypothetical protein